MAISNSYSLPFPILRIKSWLRVSNYSTAHAVLARQLLRHTSEEGTLSNPLQAQLYSIPWGKTNSSACVEFYELRQMAVLTNESMAHFSHNVYWVWDPSVQITFALRWIDAIVEAKFLSAWIATVGKALLPAVKRRSSSARHYVYKADEVRFHSILTSTLDWGEGSLSRPSRFTPRGSNWMYRLPIGLPSIILLGPGITCRLRMRRKWKRTGKGESIGTAMLSKRISTKFGNRAATTEVLRNISF
jgi:hypothetical protein